MSKTKDFTIQTGDGFEIDLDVTVEYHTETADMTRPGAGKSTEKVIDAIWIDMTDEEIGKRVRKWFYKHGDYHDEIWEKLNK